MPGHGHASCLHSPISNGSPLINPNSLFSAPEGAPDQAPAASPPPTTNPFQAPDFGENETFLIEGEQASFSDMETGQRQAG